METFLSAHSTQFSAPTIHDSLSHLESIMDEPTPQSFLKMEDLHTSSPPAAPSINLLQASPAPVIVHSKPAKKRKSWGQELPEPKTSLPPRKRAKTDDEKEQRRIERIKRNRAAAHNSRERKRQETETLAVALARANAELEAYRSLHGPLPASVVLPEVTLKIDDEEVDTPTPSLVESHGSLDRDSSPVSPALRPENFIKQESLDTTLLNMTPLYNLDAKPVQTSLAPLDLTQHSAAMLCDLQCRSSSPRPDALSLHTIWWTRLFLYLMTLQLRTCYQTLLTAIWSLSPSRMERWMQASTRRSTSPLTTSSMTPRLLRSMALAQRNAATAQPTSQCASSALSRPSRIPSSESLSNGVAWRRRLTLSSRETDRHGRKVADKSDRRKAKN